MSNKTSQYYLIGRRSHGLTHQSLTNLLLAVVDHELKKFVLVVWGKNTSSSYDFSVVAALWKYDVEVRVEVD